MERPTSTFTLPTTGFIVVLKTWITVREEEFINEPIMKSASIESNAGAVKSNIKVEASVSTEVEHRTITSAVVSIDEKTDVLEMYLELPKDDGTFLKEQIEKITLKKKEE